MRYTKLLQVEKFSGHTFIPSLLGPDALVVDLGANEGEFIMKVQKQFGCRCCAVEPTPSLYSNLKSIPGIEAYPYAVSDKDGQTQFSISHDSQASRINSDDAAKKETVIVDTRSLQSLLKELNAQTIDFLKVDIEGAEIGLVMNTPDEVFGRIKQISLEFHDMFGFCSRQEVLAAIARLKKLGFDAMNWGGIYGTGYFIKTPDAYRKDNLNWLFVNRSAHHISPLKRWFIRYLAWPAWHLSYRLRAWRWEAIARKKTGR
jgi:FkbM family methyltransferase